LEPLGAVLELAAEFLVACLIHMELLAALAGVGTPFESRMGGFELAVGSEYLPFDEAEIPKEADKNGQGRVNGSGPDAAAEVAQNLSRELRPCVNTRSQGRRFLP
jgi:hypothetical protein